MRDHEIQGGYGVLDSPRAGSEAKSLFSGQLAVMHDATCGLIIPPLHWPRWPPFWVTMSLKPESWPSMPPPAMASQPFHAQAVQKLLANHQLDLDW